VNNATVINNQEELRCLLESQLQGHQQPISCMDIVRGIVFTGSQDHTLKVILKLYFCRKLSINRHFPFWHLGF